MAVVSWLTEDQWFRLFQRIRPHAMTLEEFKLSCFEGKLDTCLKKDALEKVQQTLRDILQEEGRIKDASAKIGGKKSEIAAKLTELIVTPSLISPGLLDVGAKSPAASTGTASHTTRPPVAHELSSKIHANVRAERQRDVVNEFISADLSSPGRAALSKSNGLFPTSDQQSLDTEYLRPGSEFPFLSPLLEVVHLIKRIRIGNGNCTTSFEVPKEYRTELAQRRARIVMLPMAQQCNSPVAWPKVKELYVFVNAIGITAPWRRTWPQRVADTEKSYLPLDITARISLQSTYQQVSIDCFDKSYSAVTAILVCRQRSDMDVISALSEGSRDTRWRTAINSLRRILQCTEGDDDVEAERPLVSTKCPLSQTRIEIPVRGATCEHLQCVDLRAFLRAGHTACCWSCPLCDRPMHPTVDGLVIDVTFSEALQAIKTSDKIRFLRLQGHDDWLHWSPVTPAEMIALDDDLTPTFSPARLTRLSPPKTMRRDYSKDVLPQLMDKAGTPENPICVDE